MSSTQEHWVFKCPHCSKKTELIFPDCLVITAESHSDPGIKDSHLKCKECGHKLDHAQKKEFLGVEKLKIAVMGCVVNGPGESRHADIGISLPGALEQPVAPVYTDGKQTATLKGEGIKEEFIRILEDYIAKKYS